MYYIDDSDQFHYYLRDKNNECIFSVIKHMSICDDDITDIIVSLVGNDGVYFVKDGWLQSKDMSICPIKHYPSFMKKIHKVYRWLKLGNKLEYQYTRFYN